MGMVSALGKIALPGMRIFLLSLVCVAAYETEWPEEQCCSAEHYRITWVCLGMEELQPNQPQYKAFF